MPVRGGFTQVRVADGYAPHRLEGLIGHPTQVRGVDRALLLEASGVDGHPPPYVRDWWAYTYVRERDWLPPYRLEGSVPPHTPK